MNKKELESKIKEKRELNLKLIKTMHKNLDKRTIELLEKNKSIFENFIILLAWFSIKIGLTIIENEIIVKDTIPT